jgi:hypothetical protein
VTGLELYTSRYGVVRCNQEGKVTYCQAWEKDHVKQGIGVSSHFATKLISSEKESHDLYEKVYSHLYQSLKIHYLRQIIHNILKDKKKVTLDPDVEELLIKYDWPGNVREMENVIDRALILADNGRITLTDLPPQITKSVQLSHSGEHTEPSGTLREQVRKHEADMILRAIEEAGGDRRAAAQKLDIGLSSLYRKLEEFEEQEAASRKTPRPS